MDTQLRTIAKTISWRVFGTMITALLIWKLTGQGALGMSIGIIDCVLKMMIYYAHERVWNGIPLGRSALHGEDSQSSHERTIAGLELTQ